MDLPPSLGQLTMLRVLDVVGNRLRSLPLELSTLNLDALWIDGSQVGGRREGGGGGRCVCKGNV